jgi:hypothetical protein
MLPRARIRMMCGPSEQDEGCCHGIRTSQQLLHTSTQSLKQGKIPLFTALATLSSCTPSSRPPPGAPNPRPQPSGLPPGAPNPRPQRPSPIPLRPIMSCHVGGLVVDLRAGTGTRGWRLISAEEVHLTARSDRLTDTWAQQWTTCMSVVSGY